MSLRLIYIANKKGMKFPQFLRELSARISVLDHSSYNKALNGKSKFIQDTLN